VIMDKRTMQLKDRTPFARRVLIYLRSQDPPMSISQLASRVGVTRQAFYNWMWNISTPNPENLEVLAEKTGIALQDLEIDLAASQGWEPPIAFAEFYRQAEHAAQAEQWADIDEILPKLRLTISWQDEEGDHIDLARDVLVQKASLRQKAVKLLFIVRGWEAMRRLDQ
jgi:transcriptional regulator with XRE-family HTH domain